MITNGRKLVLRIRIGFNADPDPAFYVQWESCESGPGSGSRF